MPIMVVNSIKTTPFVEISAPNNDIIVSPIRIPIIFLLLNKSAIGTIKNNPNPYPICVRVVSSPEKVEEMFKSFAMN
ncbi:hypothetical protein J19TS1_22720 [Heyndrickxia oleronia]|nr:hypothetical protein J19TS1_22720 [Heyndrickxia oleronia]